MTKSVTNWAGTTTCRPARVEHPVSVEEIQALVASCRDRGIPLKVVGAAHSYNDIFHVPSHGVLVSLDRFASIERVDPQQRTVTFQGGARIPALICHLRREGLALVNLGTNVFDTYIGACATGYHGSGREFGIQASHLLSLEFVNGEGRRLTVPSDHPLFPAVAVGLGAFGIVTRATVRCEPAVNLRVTVRKEPLASIEERCDEELRRHKHFKFIWVPHTDRFFTWAASETLDAPASLARKARGLLWDGFVLNNGLHELLLTCAGAGRRRVPSINRTMSRLLHRDGTMVLDSHWAYFLPHVLRQDAIEIAVPAAAAFVALRRLMTIVEHGPFLVESPVEVRFVRGDGFWLSPAFGQDVCLIGTKIHFPRWRRRAEYAAYFRAVSDLMVAFGGRPHWGKQQFQDATYFRTVFPRWDDFWAEAARQDPAGIFRNDFLARLTGAGHGA